MKKSAGILLYRFDNDVLQVMLLHPGGPFWKNKDKAAWSVPKGEFTDDEDALEAAKREFNEETGAAVQGTFVVLTPIKQNSAKMVYAFAVEGDFDPTAIKSNLFEMEWPPKSGKMITVPEVDRAAWFTETEAREKIVAGQAALIDELKQMLGNRIA